MVAETCLFEQREAERRAHKIERRDARGYAQSGTLRTSHKSQKFRCHVCKKSFSRMEILLQHFRDSNRHRADSLAQQASKQLADWLLAKDRQKHCCSICCLGFDSHTELLVHLRNTPVHKGTPEADLAATLLLPKDEARFLRRDLQGSATPSAPQSASGAAQHTQQAGHAANSSATWQVLSAGKLSNALVDAQQHAPGTDAKQVEQAAAAKVEATLSVATTSATVRDAADCQFANSADAQHHIDTARPGNAAHVSAVSHRPHGKRGAAAMLEQPGGACSSQATEMAVRSPHTKGSFQQPEFVQLLRLRSVTKKRKRHGTAKQQAIEDSVVSNSRCRQRHMSLVEAQVDNHEVQSTPVKKVPT